MRSGTGSHGCPTFKAGWADTRAVSVRKRLVATDFEAWNAPRFGVLACVLSAAVGGFLGGTLAVGLGLVEFTVPLVVSSIALCFVAGTVGAAAVDARLDPRR